jgi:YjbE family integral membrane protein
MEWWMIAFFKILLINIILSGDNAIVIAMASRNLPDHKRKKAIFWGSFGAIALRILLTLVAIFLLKVPFLSAIGSILLLWIAIKLMISSEEHSDIKGSQNMSNVVMTIILADFIMSLDNVIAITAVAQGELLLIIIGLILSIPLIIWGSSVILSTLEKYPSIVYIGAGILGFTAGEMFLKDKIILEILVHANEMIKHIIPIGMALCVVIIGWIHNRFKMSY